MSDQLPPTSSGGDRMRDTLTALRVDADRVGLSDAASVRLYHEPEEPAASPVHAAICRARVSA